ncbi:MAG: hypothetical protein HY731_00310 [Candidatus Tectomicrobia bacterium]|nr:hypothetical protein [Candidatus Tectomicrobia bacterium]
MHDHLFHPGECIALATSVEIMKRWRFFHVPLSTMLITVMVVHILASFYYGGGPGLR